MFFALSKNLKTEWYRKGIHLSSLWMPLFILLAERNFCIVLFSVLLVLDFAAEYAAYCKLSGIGSLFRRVFLRVLRGKEINRVLFVPSGAVYILAGALAVSVCFSAQAAATAMCVVLVADSNAALFGKFLGTYRFYNGKSVEGTLAFFISAVSVILLFYSEVSLTVVCLTAGLATAVEFFEKEIGIDDNFAIPLISGFVLNLISL